VKDGGGARVWPGVRVARDADQNIAETVTVDVAGRSYPKAIDTDRSSCSRPRSRRESGLAAEIDQYSPRCAAHDDIAVTVAVHVPRCGHIGAESTTSMRVVYGPGSRICDDPGVTAEIDERPARDPLAVVVSGRADNNIVVAVSIHVSGSGYGIAETARLLCRTE